MKTRIAILVLFIVVIATLTIMTNRKSITPMSEINSSVQMTQVVSNTTKSSSLYKTNAGINNYSINEHERMPEIAEQFNINHNVAINFSGKIVNQDGAALAGAAIAASIRQTYMMTPSAVGAASKTVKIETISDADGRFRIENVQGDAISIECISKDGYEAEPFVRFYGVANGGNDDPVIFKMWDKNIHENLINGAYRFQINPDGTKYIINLKAGTIGISGDGDLKVWIKTETTVKRGQKYEWTCGIEPINGEIIEETNSTASMYQAPTNGYTKAFSMRQEIYGGQRGTIGTKRFYVKMYVNSRPQYARTTIDLIAPFNGGNSGLIRLNYHLNPSGSCVLK